MKIIYAFTVLATAMTAAYSTPAEERVDSVAQPLTRTACDKAGLAWDESANVCGSQGAPSRILTEQAAEMPSQPLTRAACSKAGIEWNERTNVCGKAKVLQTMEGALPPTEDTTGQPLTRATCEAAKMQWNESSNVCGAGSMPFAAQQSAAVETPAQPLTRADCVKAGLTWNESTNVCGNTERKASTVKAVPVAMPKPKAARAEHAKSTEATKKSAKKTYKRRMTSRRQVQSAPTVPVERRPFRLFRKRPSSTQ